MKQMFWRQSLPALGLVAALVGACALPGVRDARRPVEPADVPEAAPAPDPVPPSTEFSESPGYDDVTKVEDGTLPDVKRALPDERPGLRPDAGIEEILIQGSVMGGVHTPGSVTAFDAPDLAGLGAEDVRVRGRGPSDLEIVNGEAYDAMYFEHYGVNPTIDTEEDRLSTFSVDVDTASYSMARSYLERGDLPPEEAIRVEEFINAFDYGYEPPRREVFDLSAEAFPSPHREGYHVLHLGLKGRDVRPAQRKPANLVFTIDVSGSMAAENRLGLVKRSLRLLVDELHSDDRVGLVVYGTGAKVILEPTLARNRREILDAIERLAPSGSTNAQAGIELAYRMAARNFEEGAINRVILCSDGVANNGIATDADGIFATVEREASRGVTISTVGFGMGNYNDELMEQLAQQGDGNYAYVDRDAEAHRVFVENLTGMLQVVARDVKIQVAFDDRVVSRFRLIGYENRALEHRDFEDDSVDAGEIGAGHAVTALYEVKFRDRIDDFGMVSVRFKDPSAGRSQLIERRLPANVVRPSLAHATAPTRLSFVVSSFAEKLRGSYWVRGVGYDDIQALFRELETGVPDADAVREFEGLVARAASLDERRDRFEDHLPIAKMEFDRVPVLR